MLTVGSLFAGIGGFDLGLERAGMRVIWQSEIDQYACAVLKKHWPHVPNHGDIRTITVANVERPDVLCGGFPCQDVSEAGKRAGIDAERSGLWAEFARLIRELRPRFALVENTPGLLSLGMGRVLGDLAEIGYDAEWHCVPAAAAGARHLRERVFIIATAGAMGNAEFMDARYMHDQSQVGRWASLSRIRSIFDGTSWTVEPELDRVAYGVSHRSHRIRGLGNAIVPQIAEIIGRAIVGTHMALQPDLLTPRRKDREA